MCLGIPGKVVELRDDCGFLMGTVDFGGVRREVCLAYVQSDIQVGDFVVVHVGFAISRVDEAEARTMIVRGFIEPISKHLPLEYAVELNRLVELEMEGSVG